MLIDYKQIIKKYNLEIKNILHIGAHEAEEYELYFNNGAKKVIWIEANPMLAENLKFKLDQTKNIVFQSVISDTDNQEVEFMLSNNGQSSSILELGIHKNLFPDINYINKIKLKTKTLKTLFEQTKIDFKIIDFINLDIQGAELLALKGAGKKLEHVKAIYTEINTAHVYKNCALMSEIDDYLFNFGFKRVETVMWQDHPWGDALYILDK